MERKIFILLFFTTFIASAQIKGKISDETGEALPFASISTENTFEGTLSNENGEYELKLKNYDKQILIFKYLGYKTKRIYISRENEPINLNVTLVKEDLVLGDIVIHAEKKNANHIIKKAIDNKDKNTHNTSKFTADYYSKGLIKLLNLPKAIKIKLPGSNPNDTLGPGIVYLSETMSKISYQKPDKLKEQILASRVSGDNKGYSLNTAKESFFDFYEDLIELNDFSDIKMISPLAKNAFSYYKYTLVASFSDGDKFIHKIKITPKRDKEPVFEGDIYIVEGSWAIYGIELEILGYRILEPTLEKIELVQNFNYNPSMDIWIKNMQSLDAIGGLFGIKLQFKFSYVFNNYNFVDSFDKKLFSKEITVFEPDANKKDYDYWNSNRQIPLTDEEVKDYMVKDSLELVKNSKTYIDSLDRANNKFKPLKVLFGYTYRNTPKDYLFRYKGLANIFSTEFNTVQGLAMDSYIGYIKKNKERGSETQFKMDFNYGFVENKLRVVGRIDHTFNNINNRRLVLNGGSSIEQFNGEKPISGIVNSVATLFFRRNYMKLYNKDFVRLYYEEEVTNGTFLSGSLEYAHRQPLFNNTDYSFFYRKREFTSNNPIEPYNYLDSAFEKHSLFKAKISAKFNFGQEYVSLPNKKINIKKDNYPVVKIDFEKAFSINNKEYNYNYLSANISHEFPINNKGFFSYNIKAGKYFNANDISFIDYHHFRGNQTYVSIDDQNKDAFNLLPYYSLSTNKEFLEMHLQHNFKGFVMNKIPLINRLQWNLVLGYHNAITTDRKPYHEFSVGFSNINIFKFNRLGVDYVRSYQGGKFTDEGVVLRVNF